MNPFTHLQPLKIAVASFFLTTVAACTVAPGLSTPGPAVPDISQNAPRIDIPDSVPVATDRYGLAPAADSQQPLVLRIWLDCSTSHAASLLKSNIDTLIADLDRHKHRVAGTEVICFSNGTRSIWAEVPEKFIWGTPPSVQEFVPNFDKASPKEKMFKDARDDFVLKQ